MSGWGFRAVEGAWQRDRSPGPAEGQHAGLGGLESPARPDAVEGDVAGSETGCHGGGCGRELASGEGPPPWTVKRWPLLGAPRLKADQSRETLDPWHLLVLSGTHLPHCVQLHLHSHLCGRDDTEGTWLHLGPLLPLAQPRSTCHSLTCPSTAFYRWPWRLTPTWSQPLGWAPRTGEGGMRSASCPLPRSSQPISSVVEVPAGGAGHSGRVLSRMLLRAHGFKLG